MKNKEYTVYDVINARYNLEIVCLLCGSHEVTYHDYAIDAYCADCGKWQLETLENYSNHMTYKEAMRVFQHDILPGVQHQHEQYGRIDRPARREAWNNFTDQLRKERRITSWQYDNWDHPDCIESNT